MPPINGVNKCRVFLEVIHITHSIKFHIFLTNSILRSDDAACFGQTLKKYAHCHAI